MRPADNTRLLTQTELAHRWQVSKSLLERQRAGEEGPTFIRIGRQVRYRLSDIEQYESSNCVSVEGAA